MGMTRSYPECPNSAVPYPLVVADILLRHEPDEEEEEDDEQKKENDDDDDEAADGYSE